MKTQLSIFFLCAIMLFSSCSVLEQAQNIQRFIECEFTLDNIHVVEIGGIKVSSLKSPDDIGFLGMMSLTNQLINGSLPARISIELKASNNNSSMASIAGMEWKILMKEEDFLAGEINDYIEVQPNSSTVFPVHVDLDILQLFQSETLPQLLNFVFSDNKAEELKKMSVGIQIKPYYRVGSVIQKYPGYLNIDF